MHSMLVSGVGEYHLNEDYCFYGFCLFSANIWRHIIGNWGWQIKPIKSMFYSPLINDKSAASVEYQDITYYLVWRSYMFVCNYWWSGNRTSAWSVLVRLPLKTQSRFRYCRLLTVCWSSTHARRLKCHWHAPGGELGVIRKRWVSGHTSQLLFLCIHSNGHSITDKYHSKMG